MKAFFAKHKRAMSLTMMTFLLSIMSAVGVFAEGETASSTISSAVTTALGSVQSDAMSMIASVLPYALAIVGAIIVVTIGIRVFKKVSGR